MMKSALRIFVLFFIGVGLKAQSPCLAGDTLKIVVIGSSTAAGSGASTSDSAWVNRYRNYLQSINSANQVVNLARGGYNTWRLMSDNFSPPANHPTPDTLRNISEALRRTPDAIIINLPSNDAAMGTGISQQMSNFIAMDSVAASQGVPLWVCTTQPRNFNANGTFIQIGVRDSILSYFGTRAIDFWTGLADPFNNIDPFYDSGDGVHLNDHGHRLLFNRVVQKQIPDSLVTALPGLDLSPRKIHWLNPSPCGSPHSIFQVTIANLRMDSLNNAAQIKLLREDLASGQVDTLTQNLTSIQACAYAQVNFVLNTTAQQNWRLWVICHSLEDSLRANDTSSSLFVSSSELPSLSTRDTNFCLGDSLSLRANSTDSIFWFSDSSLQNTIAQGNSYHYGLARNDTLYLQARKGPFVYLDQLSAANTSNINWNGAMFNLIAGNQAISLDSILFYSGSSADLQVNLRTHSGTYQGTENNPSAWSASLSDSVYNAQADSAYFLNFGSITLNPGDTLACYLYLENASHRLKYQSGGAMQLYAGNALTVEAGSGIAHTFGTIYHPRHINASFYYHYGNNPLGQCQGAVEELSLKESEAILDLGPDTLHDLSEDLIIHLPAGFSNAYWWLSPQSGDSLIIPAFSHNDSDSLWIVLSAEDSLGCSHTDSLLVRFIQYFALDDKGLDQLELYPNPAKENLWLRQTRDRRIELELYNMLGQRVLFHSGKDKVQQVRLSLEAGLYQVYLNGRPQEILLIE